MTDLDTLMDLDPLSLTKSDLDAIIAHHRNNRAKAEEATAAKGSRKGPVPKGKIDLTSLISGMTGAAPKASAPAAASPTKPATPGGIRRL